MHMNMHMNNNDVNSAEGYMSACRVASSMTAKVHVCYCSHSAGGMPGPHMNMNRHVTQEEAHACDLASHVAPLAS
jgi:hypothetical protein